MTRGKTPLKTDERCSIGIGLVDDLQYEQQASDAQSSAPPRSNQCEVCGNIKSVKPSYGGIICQSCRHFFRENLLNRYRSSGKINGGPGQASYAPSVSKRGYVCKSGQIGKCEVKFGKRSKCVACRFDKCLRIGLIPEMVLAEEHEGRGRQKQTT